MNYSDFSKQTRSQKAILCIHGANEKIRFFTDESGGIFTKSLKYFVNSIEVDGVSLVKNSSEVLAQGQFYWDNKNKKLFIRLSNDSNPDLHFIVAKYSFFWSNFPLILPYDLQSGVDVEFDSRVKDIGELKLELDYENTGIALESSSNITLENTDGFFDEIFDVLIFENQPIRFYSYNPEMSASESKLIFRGLIENKSFNPKEIKFAIKDEFYKLRDSLNLNLFSSADGKFEESLINKPKRRLYGKFSSLKTTAIDKMLGSFDMIGVISVDPNSSLINGVGTSFLTQLSIGDTVTVVSNNLEIEMSVNEILSDVQFVASEEIEGGFSDLSAVIESNIYSKYFNRRWHISGHKLTETKPVVSNIIDGTTFEVINSIDIFNGDNLFINGASYTVLTVDNNKIKVNQNIVPSLVIGQDFLKIPVFNAYIGPKKLIYSRDYLIENNLSDCVLVLNENAEANISIPSKTLFHLKFTNGSRSVHHSGGSVDLRTVFKTRDYIKPSDPTYFYYYEILDVTQDTIQLREVFNEVTITINAFHKSINWASDNEIITVDCIGKPDNAGEWIKYPSQIVKDILTNDVGSSINNESFDQSYVDAKYLMSLACPYSDGEDSPIIRDVISNVNQSVFGSLYFNNNFEFCYKILNAEKPQDILKIKDDDVIGFDSITKNSIVNKVLISYRDETNKVTGELVDFIKIVDSDFVNKMIGIKNEKKIKTFLFSEEQADLIARRYAFFNSLTNSIVRVKAKLNLSLLNLNDPVLIDFDRIYKRYAGRNKRKIGIVNYISKDESGVTLQLNDVGGIFNRIATIAQNEIDSISTASEDQIAKSGFIVDNLNETPNNSEEFLGSNLIG